MKDNGSYVLGIISLIMVSVSCVLFVFYNVGGGRKSNSKNVRYAGYLGKLLFAASVILISVSLILPYSKQNVKITPPINDDQSRDTLTVEEAKNLSVGKENYHSEVLGGIGASNIDAEQLGTPPWSQ